MNFRVLYTDTFCSNIADHVDYLRSNHVADDIIERWYDRLFSRIDGLSVFPKSGPVDEVITNDLRREVRKLVYGRYVITYHVDESNQRVLVLAMVHGSRRK
jgi:plasmid stabilization system protein ParE